MHAVVGPFWKSNPWTAAYRQDRLQPSERAVGWLSGLLPVAAAGRVRGGRGFDERYFMYMEDVDLGDRLAAAGWQNVYVPSAEILHDKGHSTGRDPARNLAAHHASTYTFLADRHRGWWQAPLRWTIRSALAARARLVVGSSRRKLAKGAAVKRGDYGESRAGRRGHPGRRAGHALASADVVGAQADAADGRSAVPDSSAVADRRSGRSATSCWARRTRPRCSRPSSATVPSWACEIEYVVENEPRGTGGGIANVASKLRYDTALVFNGDVLSGADLGALLASHHEREADVTLHLVRVGDPRAFGCVPTDSNGAVTAFLEKTQDPPTDQINAGCYVFQREVIERIPKGREVSVEREVFPALLSDGLKVCGYVDATYWRDMGTPDDFVRGSADLVRGIAPSPALKGHRGEELVHDGAAVAPGALLIGGTVVGRGAEIGPGARLDGAVIFDGARIEAGSVIERSIIGFGARIGPRALIRDGVIGDGADIGARCELLRGARVWPGVHIPDGGIRYSTDV